MAGEKNDNVEREKHEGRKQRMGGGGVEANGEPH